MFSVLTIGNSGKGLSIGHDVSLDNVETRNFMQGNSLHSMAKQYPQARRYPTAGDAPRGVLPERYMDAALPVSYSQMMGDSTEVVLNGLSCGVMSYL